MKANDGISLGLAGFSEFKSRKLIQLCIPKFVQTLLFTMSPK